MTIAVAPPQTITAEAYLAQEVELETRNEYRNGEIVPMTGGTPAHNELNANLVFLLKAALRKQPYSIFITDQRLWIPERNLYTYPDTMVTPRPVELQSGRKDTVINPILLAEVLSKSTQQYDRTEKFAAYRTIASFQEYLLIDQSRPYVEQYVKQAANQWLFTEHIGLDKTLTLRSLNNIEIALADLYEAIAFDAADV
ncbi:MAG: Uma2 family endonuclease [Spirulinaceae cyanobacterium]